MITKLVGMYFFANDAEHEGYRTGTIIAQLSPLEYLAAFDAMGDDKSGVTMPSEVVPSSEMVEVCDCCGSRRWNFFATRKALRGFIDWLNTDHSEEKTSEVVKLITH